MMRTRLTNKEAMKLNDCPTTMDAPHANPEADEYVTGDPSKFGEDPDMSRPWEEENKKREETGHALLKKNAYASMVQEAKELEAKALRCLKMAETILPDAPTDVVERQAVDFMTMSSKSVVATLRRMREFDEQISEARVAKVVDAVMEVLSEEAEEEEEEEKALKKGEKEEDKEEKKEEEKKCAEKEEKEEEDKEKIASIVQAVLEVIAEEEEEEKKSKVTIPAEIPGANKSDNSKLKAGEKEEEVEEKKEEKKEAAKKEEKAPIAPVAPVAPIAPVEEKKEEPKKVEAAKEEKKEEKKMEAPVIEAPKIEEKKAGELPEALKKHIEEKKEEKKEEPKDEPKKEAGLEVSFDEIGDVMASQEDVALLSQLFTASEEVEDKKATIQTLKTVTASKSEDEIDKLASLWNRL